MQGFRTLQKQTIKLFVSLIVLTIPAPTYGRELTVREWFTSLVRFASELRFRVHPSERTTHVLKPLTADGYVDYLEAVNQHAQEGVAKRQNAAVLLWMAVGPSAVPACQRRALVSSPHFKLVECLPQEDQQQFETATKFGKRTDSAFVETRAGESQCTAESRVLKKLRDSPWVEKEHRSAADWLRKNEQPLELVTRATLRSAYYSPIVQVNEGFIDSGIMATDGIIYRDELREPVEDLGKALLARSMLSAGREHWNEAWEDIFACHRLARLYAKGPLWSHVWTGATLDEKATDTTIELLRCNAVDVSLLRRITDGRKQLPTFPSIATRLNNAERWQFLDFVTRVPRKRLNFLAFIGPRHESDLVLRIAGYVFLWVADWDTVLRRANEWFDRRVAIATMPLATDRLAACHRLQRDSAEKWEAANEFVSSSSKLIPSALLLAFPRLITTYITSFLECYLANPDGAIYRLLARRSAKHRLTTTAIALKRYQLKHDRLPSELEQLMPDLLNQIPRDPYDGRPLRYRQLERGFVVYTVGPNGEDDIGAAKRMSMGQEDDIAITLSD